VNDLAGFRIAALAVTTDNSNNYPSQTAFNTIGGIGVSGYSSYTSSYQTTSSSGPELVTSDSFSVSVSNSLVVVFAVGGGSQCQQLSGIQGLQIDANTANANPIITIGHADLASGSYTATMAASQCAAGQDPNHAGNVLGVFVFSPVGTPPSVSLLSPFYYGDCVSINGVDTPMTSGATIVSTSWMWGDGSVTQAGFPTTHVYANTGTYVVQVTATDSNGLEGVATQSVSVTGSIALLPPQLSLFTPTTNGLSVSVNGVANSNACGPTQPIPSFLFNWGDGSSSRGSFAQSHTYSQDGLYDVCVTAYDSFGLRTTECGTAHVGNSVQPAPARLMLAATPAQLGSSNQYLGPWIVNALVYDGNDNPLPGVPVSFSMSGLNNNVLVSSPTNSFGFSAITATPDPQASSAFVKATTGGLTGYLSVPLGESITSASQSQLGTAGMTMSEVMLGPNSTPSFVDVRTFVDTSYCYSNAARSTTTTNSCLSLIGGNGQTISCANIGNAITGISCAGAAVAGISCAGSTIFPPLVTICGATFEFGLAATPDCVLGVMGSLLNVQTPPPQPDWNQGHFYGVVSTASTVQTIVCNLNSLSSILPSAGGIVTTIDGSSQITIPPNHSITQTPIPITMSQISAAQVSTVITAPKVPVGGIVNIGIGSSQPLRAATLTLTYDPSTVPSGYGVSIYQDGVWRMLPTALLNGKATADITTSGDYAVFASPPSIAVSDFFTSGILSPLPTDSAGNSKVAVLLSNGIVIGTIPNPLLIWVNITDTGSSSLQSLRLSENLPVDWIVLGIPQGSTITFGPITITISPGNPEMLRLSVSNITAVLGHPLMPGKSLLLPIALVYKLIGTSQLIASYPRTYTTNSIAGAWTQVGFRGTEATSTGSAFFIAYVKMT
jgi:hypothetical protein